MGIDAEATREPSSACRDATAAEIRNGYWFWGVVVTVILLVELAGAAAHWLDQHVGVTIPWTTISGMVGHLENLWPTAAVVVVAVIAPVAYYALAPVDPPRLGNRSRLGRRYVGPAPERDPVGWYNAPVVLALCAIASIVAVAVFDDDFQRAYVIYGALFFFGIVVPSLLMLCAHREVGFTSLFCTISLLRVRNDWKAAIATIALTAGLTILVIHLAFYPWPDITKEPVRYAGLTATDARTRAIQEVAQLRNGNGPLVYSTQARQVVIGKEAWVVYFSFPDGSDSGCTVIVSSSKPIDASPECSTATAPT